LSAFIAPDGVGFQTAEGKGVVGVTEVVVRLAVLAVGVAESVTV
jgi:hypothetical protein